VGASSGAVALAATLALAIKWSALSESAKSCADNHDVNSCQRACDGGSPIGCVTLGDMYAAGRGGLTKDEARTVALYQRACDDGRAYGCASLGAMYAAGRGGLTKDEARAVALYQRACDDGDAFGCARLGFMHFTGRSVERRGARSGALSARLRRRRRYRLR
jgi:TPR repeat protein